MPVYPVPIQRLDSRAKLPAYGSADAAGADLYALADDPVEIAPGTTVLIHTGLAAAIPQGCVGLIFARSGLASKQGLAPANKVGVIAQLAIVPYITADFQERDTLDETDRGAGGFGSTGSR